MSENYVSRWLRAMRTDSRLTLAEKGFAGVLSTFATHETGRDCYPSNLRLSLMGDVTERSITRYRNKLVATGWIAIVRDGRGREATEVELTFPDPSCYDLSLLTRKLDDETRQDCQVKPDKGVRFQNANLTNLSTQTRQDCQVKPDTGVTPPTHGPTQEPTQRESAGAQSRSVAHEQTREADRSLPEQIGPEQQASELVTAEIVEIPRKVEQPPVTGQALSKKLPPRSVPWTHDEVGEDGEPHYKLPEHIITPSYSVYLDAVQRGVEAAGYAWTGSHIWDQIATKAKNARWTPTFLEADTRRNGEDYQRRGVHLRPDWWLRDMGTRKAGSQPYETSAQRIERAQTMGYLGESRDRTRDVLKELDL